jgi:hypothetical protein
MLFYIKNPVKNVVLYVKANKGPQVIMYPYHGGSNQLWEYKNRVIYSKLNG